MSFKTLKRTNIYMIKSFSLKNAKVVVATFNLKKAIHKSSITSIFSKLFTSGAFASTNKTHLNLFNDKMHLRLESIHLCPSKSIDEFTKSIRTYFYNAYK